MPPFMQDAMGDVFLTEEDNFGALDNAIGLSRSTGIPLSATFNNTLVRPTQQNLDLFINLENMNQTL